MVQHMYQAGLGRQQAAYALDMGEVRLRHKRAQAEHCRQPGSTTGQSYSGRQSTAILHTRMH